MGRRRFPSMLAGSKSQPATGWGLPFDDRKTCVNGDRAISRPPSFLSGLSDCDSNVM